MANFGETRGRKRGSDVVIQPGDRYGFLTVVERVEDGPRRQVRYKCVCDCGTEVIVASASLRSGATKSCGCFRRLRAHLMARAAQGIAAFVNGKGGKGDADRND